MYVCLCNAVTERQIEQAVAEGATSVKDLNRLLGVGAECGSCVRCARECLSKHQQPKQHAVKLQSIKLSNAA